MRNKDRYFGFCNPKCEGYVSRNKDRYYEFCNPKCGVCWVWAYFTLRIEISPEFSRVSLPKESLQMSEPSGAIPIQW